MKTAENCNIEKEDFTMILCPWKDISRYAPLVPGLDEALEKIAAMTEFAPGATPLKEGKFTVYHNRSVPLDQGKWENHRKMLDVQYIIKGCEVVEWTPTELLTPAGEYDPVKDVQFFDGKGTVIPVPAGYCYIVFPEDGHKPGCCLETPDDYVKIVIKLPAPEV